MATNIALPSVQSLLIAMRYQGTLLGTGTGFIVESRIGPVLVTNRHNVTGRHNGTNELLSKNGAIPDEMVIVHNAPVLGDWVERIEPILDGHGTPLWKEHPTFSSRVDFVALPLTATSGIKTYPYDLTNPGADIAIQVSDSICVVGFPFGLQGGGSLAIWATGFIASEPDINLDDLPLMLVDCRTRQGQSGSAVIFHSNGGVVRMANGDTVMMAGTTTRFLGIYSGRVNSESDLGLVWKANAIQELIQSL